MDLYLPSSEAGLSLQEMIDFDIKMASDIEGADPVIPSSELNYVDLSGMSSLETDLDLKSFEPLFDPLTFEKLEDMDVVDPAVDELNTINSWMNMSSMNNYSLDLENSVMVNPSAVLPSTLPSRQVKTEPAATVTTTTTTCNTSQTPNTRVLPTLASTAVSGTLNSVVKSEPLWSTSSVQTPQTQVANGTTVTTHVTVVRPQVTSGATGLRTNQQQSPLVTTKTHQISTSSSSSTPGNGGRGKLTSQQNNIAHTPKLNGHVSNSLNSSTGSLNSKSPHTLINNRVKSMGKPPRKDLKQEEKVLPKPAYSYSCLIALALKNSVTGSLPVSEIYSFMCEHFPYFKTAPNGWKNSVRHNLSLNKCFEKIEKPVVAGSNQRKGCLWALNPAKAHKMDEEVQKWSKKDIQGIKDAMAYPEVLDALERGEMKFESTGSLSSCSEDEDEEEELDPLTMDTLQSTPTVGTIKILNPLTKPTIQQPTQKVLTGSSSHRTNTTHSSNHHSTPAVSGRTTTTTASIIRTPSSVVARTPTTVSSTDDPDFILPDSTMTEISLQSDGALLDDLGNEISIMDSESPATGSRTGLVVRKLPSVSPIRSTVRANYVYAPSISSPHHQNLNRLVLTNAKMS